MLVMPGGGVTVKGTPLLDTPPTVTTTFPVVAPIGTVTLNIVAVQFEAAIGVPFKVTVLAPWVEPKFEPFTVNVAPTGPCVKLKLEILGPAEVTVKRTPLLEVPSTLTTTLPVVAPLGTGTTMLEAPQLVGAAARPLKVMVLEPWLAPKFAPETVTEVPNGPELGLKPLMLGGGTTVKVIPLLWTPPTVTTTGPVVAAAGTGAMMLVELQLETVAVVPLKVTLLEPCVAPKLVPVMVVETPTAPEVWLKLVIVGAGPFPPPAALKAAKIAPQLPEAASVAAAEVVPAALWI
jgi:hypothetical protein